LGVSECAAAASQVSKENQQPESCPEIPRSFVVVLKTNENLNLEVKEI